jgi:hypothetical protein
MTVKELREILAHFDDDAPVHIAYPSGDYWKTTIAPEAVVVEEEEVRYTTYHETWELVDRREDSGDDNKNVVVIRSNC